MILDRFVPIISVVRAIVVQGAILGKEPDFDLQIAHTGHGKII